MLYLIPTPIGNLEDITIRAVNTLKSVDKILAEDTRTTGHLLKHYGIQKPMDSYHIHNEHKKLASIIQLLKEGLNIALVSDAGTPGISDPGFLLVRSAIENEIELSCLPGPSAIIPALVMSGLPCDKFYFEGFLPNKKGRQTRIKRLLDLEVTFILYESPYRVIKTLEQILELGGGERLACCGREISKLYEENIRGTVHDVINMLKSKQQVKGEFVICVEGRGSL